MKFRCFIEFDGKKYYDWSLYAKDFSYSFERVKDKENYVAFSKDMCNPGFWESLMDTNYVPQHGSEIYVAPNCAVGLSDIRKNYVIKRNPDDGCCNVFSTFHATKQYFNYNNIAIIPSVKTIILNNSTRYNNHRSVLDDIRDLFPDIDMNNAALYHDSRLFIYALKVPEVWLSLIKGELKKPCISYKNLEFKTDNEINLDILYLVYKAGKNQNTKEGLEAFHMQLCALNEHNWREYPGTLSVLMSCLLNRRVDCNISKAIKEMVKESGRLPKFTSQKDLEMAQELVKYVVEIPDDMQFCTIQEITEKFIDKGIGTNVFFQLFDNIVKFRPKVIKNDG